MKIKNITSSVRRLIPPLLILAMLGGTLCGCGVIIIGGDSAETSAPTAETTLPETEESTLPFEDTEAPEVTEPAPENTEESEETVVITPVTFPSRIEEAEKRLEELTDTVDISEFEIIIATSSDIVDVLFPDERSPLYAARSNRNSMLFEKYDVDILTIYEQDVDTDTIYNDLLAAVQTGNGSEYYLDLIMIPASRAGAFLAKGLIGDMRTLPFYDTKSGNMGGSVGYERYFDLGDGTDAPENIYAIYFNRTLLGAETTDALYRASLDSSLTLETLLTASAAIGGREGDIAYTGGESDLLGNIAAELLGISYITKDRAGVPKISLSDGDILAIDEFAQKVQSLSAYTPAEGGASPLEAFIAGKVPFYMGTLADITSLYDKPIEWGILTLPSEKGLGAISDDRPVVCLPVINTRLEQTSLWLSGFNAASGEWIRDQFLAVSIENYLRDNNSCLTLHKILSQETELGFERVYAEYYEGLADATFKAAANAVSGAEKFSETLKSKLSAVNKKLAKLP